MSDMKSILKAGLIVGLCLAFLASLAILTRSSAHRYDGKRSGPPRPATMMGTEIALTMVARDESAVRPYGPVPPAVYLAGFCWELGYVLVLVSILGRRGYLDEDGFVARTTGAFLGIAFGLLSFPVFWACGMQGPPDFFDVGMSIVFMGGGHGFVVGWATYHLIRVTRVASPEQLSSAQGSPMET